MITPGSLATPSEYWDQYLPVVTSPTIEKIKYTKYGVEKKEWIRGKLGPDLLRDEVFFVVAISPPDEVDDTLAYVISSLSVGWVWNVCERQLTLDVLCHPK